MRDPQGSDPTPARAGTENLDSRTHEPLAATSTVPSWWQKRRWKGEPPPPKASWSRERREAIDARRIWAKRGFVSLVQCAIGELIVRAARNGDAFAFPLLSRRGMPKLPRTSAGDVELTPSHVRILSWVITGHFAMRRPGERQLGTDGLAITHDDLGELVGLKARQTGTLMRDLIAWNLVVADPTFVCHTPNPSPAHFGCVHSRRENAYRVTTLCVMAFGIHVPPRATAADTEGSEGLAAILERLHPGTKPEPISTGMTAARAPVAVQDAAVPDRQKLPTNKTYPRNGVNPESTRRAEESRGPDHAAAEGRREPVAPAAPPALDAPRVKARPDAPLASREAAGASAPHVVYDASELEAAHAHNPWAPPSDPGDDALREQRREQRERLREREERDRRRSLEIERRRDRDSGAGPRADVEEPGAEPCDAELAGAAKKPPALPSRDRVEGLQRQRNGAGGILTEADVERMRAEEAARKKPKIIDDDFAELAERALRSHAQKFGNGQLRPVDEALLLAIRGGGGKS